ncbi:hypothetical protein [Streptomyces jumonjinensis]|uniref:hypothetical protein n=1 Tax=Streptomyces jumonjinensis TaxID=1945 RepID=UPI0037AD1CF6
MEGFAHLHVASGHSARYGAPAPDRLAAARERGMDTLALTDRESAAAHLSTAGIE